MPIGINHAGRDDETERIEISGENIKKIFGKLLLMNKDQN